MDAVLAKDLYRWDYTAQLMLWITGKHCTPHQSNRR
jgi:hypothetical protein